jgi:hypothetical protein
MISEPQIREKLGRFLRGDLSLERFEDWLSQKSWNMHKDSSEAAQKLAAALELRLAEYSAGHLSDLTLRDELRPFVNPPIVQISFGDAPQAPIVEPPNNVEARARAQVLGFTSRVEFRQSLSPGAVVSADREQLVASG